MCYKSILIFSSSLIYVRFILARAALLCDLHRLWHVAIAQFIYKTKRIGQLVGWWDGWLRSLRDEQRTKERQEKDYTHTKNTQLIGQYLYIDRFVFGKNEIQSFHTPVGSMWFNK